MTQVPFKALRTFEAVARLESFQGAADELCVTQSAVSHQIRNLENWLGVALFDRKGRRPELLPQAQDLAHSVAKSFHALEVACARLQGQKSQKPLVIAAIPSIATSWLIPRLPSFRAAHPDIEIRVIYALHGQTIDFEEVDLAFTFGQAPVKAAHVKATPFLPGASAPVCSKWVAQNLKATPPSNSDIQNIGLLHDTDRTGWADWFAATGAPSPSDLKGPVFEDFNMLRAAAFSGQGVALCPLALVQEDVASGRLARLSDVTILQNYAYYLIERMSPDPKRALASKAFVTWAHAARDTALG